MTSLGIVIPCYNEQEVLPETCARMVALLDRLAKAGKVDRESRIYFVDDGSRDRTWELIESYVGSALPWSESSSPATAAIRTPCSPGCSRPPAMR